jgi:hypothetical protein
VTQRERTDEERAAAIKYMEYSQVGLMWSRVLGKKARKFLGKTREEFEAEGRSDELRDRLLELEKRQDFMAEAVRAAVAEEYQKTYTTVTP